MGARRHPRATARRTHATCSHRHSQVTQGHVPHIAQSFDARKTFGTGCTHRLCAAHQIRTGNDHCENMPRQCREKATMRIDARDQ
eukprot:4439714-Pyramimonas_sp.AAC.1